MRGESTRLGTKFGSDVSTRRSGVTLVEVMAVVVIIGIITAITLPAIQHARESARRMSCQNNLKQIMLACHSYEASFKRLPNSISPLRDLLVEVEPNLSRMVSQGESFSPPAIYGCPSDYMLSDAYGTYRFSYFLSRGSTLLGYDGLVLGIKARRLGEVTDGLSQSSAFSERLVTIHALVGNESSLNVTRDQRLQQPLRTYFAVPKSYRPGQEDEFLSDARIIRRSGNPRLGGIIRPTLGIGVPFASEEYFNHIGPPNEWSFSQEMSFLWMQPPSSLHDDGVNLVYADGHVEFVPETVDLKVWRSIGTIQLGD